VSAIDELEKKCTQCLEIKLTAMFYKQKQTSKNGVVWHYYDSMCKVCRSEYSGKSHRRTKIEAILYKGGRCESCGYDNLDYPEVFDFHHINPSIKDFAIAKRMRSVSGVKNELDKCVLLCSNCHRILHSSR